MDHPTRPPRLSELPRSSRRRATISDHSQTSPVVPPSASTSTSLPSIRHLHPHLPSSAPFFASLPQLVAPDPVPSDTTTFTVPQPPPSELHPGMEGSDSEKEATVPPKKRRKRQVLSCTECKRRKIRCDRNQPCGPCTHRNESSKCQWHQIEANSGDKYVTRTEYDQLKAKVDQLESIVARLAGNLPSLIEPSNPSASAFSGPAPAYAHIHRPPPVSSRSYQLATDSHLEPYPQRVTSLPSSSHGLIPETSMSPQLNRDAFHTLSRMYPRVQTPHRQLLPSLAAMTTSFEHSPDVRSKKRHAQTFTWRGERLRKLFQATHGPAPLQFSRNQHRRLWSQCPNLQLSTFGLLHLVCAVARLVTLLHLFLSLSVFAMLQTMFTHHLMVVNAIVQTTDSGR